MLLNLKINGYQKKIQCEPSESLLDVLRKEGYKSVKKGCDKGSCGICTVLMDGKPVLSCSLYAAKAEEHEITTIEGIQEEAKVVADFITNEGVEQCGYCSPGFVLTVIAMKNELISPSEEDIRHYLLGNLCRCSGYEGQLRAIKKYLGVQ